MEDRRFEEMIISALSEVRQELKDLRKDVTDLKTDVGWIKGKLEGRSDTRHLLLTAISVAAAIGAVIVAIVK